jgi:hypothetical protein
MVQLETLLPATVDGEPVGEYTASLYKNISGTPIVTITPCEGTAGCWQYQLKTLLQIDEWAIGKPSDLLTIDAGQMWVVHNMRALYNEILTTCIQDAI